MLKSMALSRMPAVLLFSGAQVKATQTDTGYTQTAISGSDGIYNLPNLPVGSYKIDVVVQAFKLTPSQALFFKWVTMFRSTLELEVGSVSEHVNVSADAAMVQNAGHVHLTSHRSASHCGFASHGRQATDLILLSEEPLNRQTPLVSLPRMIPNRSRVSVAGGQINGNNYLLDGGDHNDSHSNVNMPFPFPDALQEFSVQTSGNLRPLRPGTRLCRQRGHKIRDKTPFMEIYSSSSEMETSTPATYFATAQDSLHRNQFAAPSVARSDATRYSCSPDFKQHESVRLHRSRSPFVPTAAALNGDFSTLESVACHRNKTAPPRQLYNPANGAPYANNHIDPATFNPAALNLLKLIPSQRAQSIPTVAERSRTPFESKQRKPICWPCRLGAKSK